MFSWGELTQNINTFIYLKKLMRWQKLPAREIKEMQLGKLKRLLIYCYDNFSFYKDRFTKAGFDPYRMTGLEDLSSLPLLTKEEYRQFSYQLMDRHPKKYDRMYKDSTSGSTGIPLEIRRTWSERAYMRAKWLQALYLNGYSISDVTFALPAPHRIKRDSILQLIGLGRRYTLPYSETPEVMLDGYLKAKPDVFYANRSQIVLMAIYARRNNIAIPLPRKFYMSVAETLDDNSRRIMADVFGNRLIQAYGSVECGNLAWQELGEDFFHFYHATNILELVDEGGDVAQNLGYSVITDLHIYSFPLIRYGLGDFVETGDLNGLGVIKNVRGRQNDWITFQDGSHIPFHAFYEVMAKHPEILQFLFIQESYTLVRLLLVPGRATGLDAIEGQLLSGLRSAIQREEVELKIEWVNEIPRDTSGKLRKLISKVDSAISD